MHFTFDWTINIPTIFTAVWAVGVFINYGRKVVRYLRGINYKVNVMWAQFGKEHPDLARDEAAMEAL